MGITDVTSKKVLTASRKGEEELLQLIVRGIVDMREAIDGARYPEAAKEIAKRVDVFYGKQMEDARHAGYKEGYRDRGHRGFKIDDLIEATDLPTS